MTLRRLPRTYLSILAGLLVLACDGSTGPSHRSVEALAGSWEQTLLLYRADVPSPLTIEASATLPTCPASGVCLIRPYILMLRADTTYNFATVTAGDTVVVGFPGSFVLFGDSLHLENTPFTSHLAASANRLVLRTDSNVDSALAVRLGFPWPSGADSLLIHTTQRFDRR